MDTAQNKISCGDTKFCAECTVGGGDASSTIKSHTLNALDRCDLYSGPSRVVVNTTPAKNS